MKRSALPFVRGVYGRRGEMPEREGLPGRPKPARDIAAAVVTHAPANGHGAGGQRRHTAVEKGRAGVAPLVGQDLDIGPPPVVIDSDMHIFPAATTAHAPPVAMDPMAARANPGPGLDIDMEQVTGPGPLVLAHGHRGPGRPRG